MWTEVTDTRAKQRSKGVSIGTMHKTVSET